MKLLDRANNREEFLSFTETEDIAFCEEVRSFIIDSVSKTGGHLSSNLGVVELTIALHKVFDPYKDRIVFDVGHQSYVHKILSNRKDGFSTLRQFGGMSGFPKPGESDADAFVGGHASNSVSAALGIARARTLNNDDYSVIAVIGDGALTGGLAYEGLNDAGQSGEPLIVVLNDNGMSIQQNVGAIAKFLSYQRTRISYLTFKRLFRAFTKTIPGGRFLYQFVHKIKTAMKKALISSNIFDQMGFEYLGPIDGHNIKQLTYILKEAKERNCPVLLHIITQKGHGYSYAEESPDEYHGVSSFDPCVGAKENSNVTFSTVFGETLCSLAKQDHRICAITAAMEQGTGLSTFAELYPKRFFDVGIAEGHAVTMASGMAKQGLLPVVAIYSTFLQRAYDMLIHDTAISRLHVVIAVDRAGLVGNDGETHHGVFDVGYLRSVPGMTIYCPASTQELRGMLKHAIYEESGPVAVRYPRGGNGNYQKCYFEDSLLRNGSNLTIVTYGTTINDVVVAAEKLSEYGIYADVIKLAKIAPLDCSLICQSVMKTGSLIVVEECMDSCSCGREIVSELVQSGLNEFSLKLMNLGDRFVTHGSVATLKRACRIDVDAIVDYSKELVRSEEDET